MKTAFWCLGKTNEAYLREGIGIFTKRLGHYLPFEWVEWPDVRGKFKDPEKLKAAEGKLILQKLGSNDFLVLLDEKGKTYTSEAFSAWFGDKMARESRNVVFLVGGAYGFSPEVYARANAKIRLSDMTFSHQMVRLFFAEQLYRAMTIMKGEPYHNS